MAKARPRHIVTGKMAFNDVDARGQQVIEMGPCGPGGTTKGASGKKLRKKELTHIRFRFEDKVWLRENKIKHFAEFWVRKDWVVTMLTPAEK